MKPFLKYVGGKGQVLPQISQHFPTQFRDYYEPFLGGGAVYFYMKEHFANGSRKFYLSDLNSSLVQCYIGLALMPEKVYEELSELEFTALDYYEIREQFNEEKAWTGYPTAPQTARFIYLNKQGFNGLYRENRSGKFNVPFGKRDRKNELFSLEELNAYAGFMKKDGDSEIHCCGYDHEKATPLCGDFIYFDPPYHDMFTQYSAGSFNIQSQIGLSDWFKKCDESGAKCILSNSDTPLIRDLYKDFRIVEIHSTCKVSGINAGRKDRVELLILGNHLEDPL